MSTPIQSQVVSPIKKSYKNHQTAFFSGACASNTSACQKTLDLDYDPALDALVDKVYEGTNAILPKRDGLDELDTLLAEYVPEVTLDISHAIYPRSRNIIAREFKKALYEADFSLAMDVLNYSSVEENLRKSLLSVQSSAKS